MSELEAFEAFEELRSVLLEKCDKAASGQVRISPETLRILIRMASKNDQGPKRAYLVVHIDTSSNPPQLLGAGVYSESASSLTAAIGKRRFAFDVFDAGGADFETARKNLFAAKKFYPGIFDWAYDLIPASERK